MAETWAWVLVYVVGFCLFQVLLYRYLQRNETSLDQATPDFGEGRPARSGPAGIDDPEREGVQCQHCGTYNERTQMFSYCRQCAERIDGG